MIIVISIDSEGVSLLMAGEGGGGGGGGRVFLSGSGGADANGRRVMPESPGCVDAVLGDRYLTLGFKDRVACWDLRRRHDDPAPAWSMEIPPDGEEPKGNNNNLLHSSRFKRSPIRPPRVSVMSHREPFHSCHVANV